MQKFSSAGGKPFEAERDRLANAAFDKKSVPAGD